MSKARDNRENNSVQFPWGAWYGDETLKLSFPPSWNVKVYSMRGAPGLADEALKKALAEPIGTVPINELARGRKKAAIIVDDISRPTRQDKILPLLIDDLKRGGIAEENIFIVMNIYHLQETVKRRIVIA